MPEHKARSATADQPEWRCGRIPICPFVLPTHFTRPGEEQGVQIVAEMEVSHFWLLVRA